MKKIVLVAMVALGASFGGDLCENICEKEVGACVAWIAGDEKEQGYCKKYFIEKKQKCLDECERKYKK